MSEKRPDDCQSCQKPCTIFFTQIVGNKATKVAMCADCPNAKKLEGNQNLGLLSQILGMLTPVASPRGTHQCPVCGMSWEQFQKSQLLGCPACYEHHAANLAQLLPRIQPELRHQGKVPARYQEIHAHERLSLLKENLGKAVVEENYELAAQLRDEIKALEELLAVQH